MGQNNFPLGSARWRCAPYGKLARLVHGHPARARRAPRPRNPGGAPDAPLPADAIAVAIAGSIDALAVQAWSLPEGSWVDKVVNTLGQTRYGHLWLARFGLIAGLGLVLAACGWWFTHRRQVEGIIAWALAAAVPLPFSLIAHASAQSHGRTFAVIADAVHLAAAAIWAGGVVMLAMVLLPVLRRASDVERRPVLIAALVRFSTLALICMAVIGVTGFYAGWLQVGNLRGPDLDSLW